jgi:hypothetical protein
MFVAINSAMTGERDREKGQHKEGCGLKGNQPEREGQASARGRSGSSG